MKKIMKNLMSIAVLSLIPILALAGCTKPVDPDPNGNDGNGGDKPDKITWNILPGTLNFEGTGSTQELEIRITSGQKEVDFSGAEISVDANGQGWVNPSRTGNKINVTATANEYYVPRGAVLTVTFEGTTRNVNISQKAADGGGDAGLDEKILVTGITGTSENTTYDSGVKNYGYFTDSTDGNRNTWFNSVYNVTPEWPFFLEYTLQTPNILDYIMYYPRSDGGNRWGSFNKFDVYITTEANPEKVKIASFERGAPNHTPCEIKLDESAENVKTVYFEIHSAYQNRVSCAEMEFYTSNGFDYSTIFADYLRTELKPGVTEDEINKIPNDMYRAVAQGLFADTYEKKFRVAEFRPYQHPDVMKASNRILHAYSLRDNPTGIYVGSGDVFCVIVEDTKGQNVSLVLQNLTMGWGSNKTLALSKGENILTAPNAGLLYVINTTNDPIPLVLETDDDKAAAAAKTVKMHFVNGNIQGYYRRNETTLTEWKQLVAAAEYTEMDVVGDYAHVTWLTAHYKSSTENIATVIKDLDELTLLEQQFVGLVKYNKVFRNRMYFMYEQNSSVHAQATMYRTSYSPDFRATFTERMSSNLWGVAHEAGHINQIHGFKWAGMTEVSNNVTSSYIQRKMTPANAPRLMSTSKWNDVTYPNTYEAAIAEIIGTEIPHATGSDFFRKLVPFWQLYLYLVEARGITDFWADLYEYYRTCQPSGSNLSHGEQQLMFVKKTCEIANMNLTEFFEKWGFLRPIDQIIKDYGDKQITITEAQIAETKAAISVYPAPPHSADEIIAIREANLNNYKN